MPTFYSGDPALTLARADVTCALGLAFSASAASADGEGPLAREAAVTSVRLTVGLQRGSLPHGTPVVRSGERGAGRGWGRSEVRAGRGEVRVGQDVGGDRKSACGLPKRREMRVLQIIVPFYSPPTPCSRFPRTKKKKKRRKGEE